MNQQLRDWAETHVGAAVEVRGEYWEVRTVRGDRCLLSTGEAKRIVPVRTVYREWMRQNIPTDVTVS